MRADRRPKSSRDVPDDPKPPKILARHIPHSNHSISQYLEILTKSLDGRNGIAILNEMIPSNSSGQGIKSPKTWPMISASSMSKSGISKRVYLKVPHHMSTDLVFRRLMSSEKKRTSCWSHRRKLCVVLSNHPIKESAAWVDR